MKTKLFNFVTIVICCSNVLGQDSSHVKIREFYISLTDISPVNIQIKYKKQLGSKAFFKIGAIDLSAQHSGNDPAGSATFGSSHYSYSGGVEVGFEFRRALSDRAIFYHGPNLGIVYSNNTSISQNPVLSPAESKTLSETKRVNLPYTFGLLCKVRPHFFISAEINPGFSASINTTRVPTSPPNISSTNSAGFGFTNRFAVLSFVYRL